MKIICGCVCFLVAVSMVAAVPVPANGFVFPDERRERRLEPVITPPVLPVIEHLERDPSTLLPNERNVKQGQVRPKFGFGGGFNVAPSSNGGLTASVSSSGSGAGGSHSASQSFSFGFNDGFSASQSASQAASFNGFGSGFSGSQAASQAASFGSHGISGAASSAAAFGGSGGSQSASQAFGFNSLNGFHPEFQSTFGEGLLDVRHRGVPDFPIPRFGRSRGIGAAAFRTGKTGFSSDDDFISILVSD